MTATTSSGITLSLIHISFPTVDFFAFLSEERNHLLTGLTVKQQNQIYGLLQQLLAMEDETSAAADALRRLLLGTLLLELKEHCRRQQEQTAENGRVSNHTVDQIQAYIAEHYAEKLTLTCLLYTSRCV